MNRQYSVILGNLGLHGGKTKIATKLHLQFMPRYDNKLMPPEHIY